MGRASRGSWSSGTGAARRAGWPASCSLTGQRGPSSRPRTEVRPRVEVAGLRRGEGRVTRRGRRVGEVVVANGERRQVARQRRRDVLVEAVRLGADVEGRREARADDAIERGDAAKAAAERETAEALAMRRQAHRRRTERVEVGRAGKGLRARRRAPERHRVVRRRDDDLGQATVRRRANEAMGGRRSRRQTGRPRAAVAAGRDGVVPAGGRTLCALAGPAL